MCIYVVSYRCCHASRNHARIDEEGWKESERKMNSRDAYIMQGIADSIST